VDERQRLDLISEIEKKRGSRVIAYLTGDRQGHWDAMDFSDVRVIEHHLDEIFRKKPPTKLDLFLYTPGGYAAVPAAIVALIREYVGTKGEFSVLIPSQAFSAGTILSLGADELVMGPGGHIGPIDTQMGGESVDTLRAYFDFASSLGLTRRANIRDIFLKVSDKVSPILLGSMQRLARESERKSLRVLESRRRPLSKKENRQIIRFLAIQVGNHGQAIHRTEALSNGIKFVRHAEQFGIRTTMSDLFGCYEQLLELDVPLARKSYDFDIPGDADDKNHDGSHTMEKPLSLVESRDRLDIAKLAYGYRFWRDAPQPPSKTVPGQKDEEGVVTTSYGAEAHVEGWESFDSKKGLPRPSGPSSQGLQEASKLEWQIVRRGKV
jgi:serine dehydrogenase proteinase